MMALSHLQFTSTKFIKSINQAGGEREEIRG